MRTPAGTSTGSQPLPTSTTSRSTPSWARRVASALASSAGRFPIDRTTAPTVVSAGMHRSCVVWALTGSRMDAVGGVPSGARPLPRGIAIVVRSSGRAQLHPGDPPREDHELTAHVSDQDVQRDPISGARILVGDMLMWSDLATLETPAGGPRGGPDRDRGTASAARPAGRSRGRDCSSTLCRPTYASTCSSARCPTPVSWVTVPGCTTSSDIYCGGLDVFAPGHSYDLIVALGGPSGCSVPTRGA